MRGLIQSLAGARQLHHGGGLARAHGSLRATKIVRDRDEDRGRLW